MYLSVYVNLCQYLFRIVLIALRLFYRKRWFHKWWTNRVYFKCFYWYYSSSCLPHKWWCLWTHRDLYSRYLSFTSDVPPRTTISPNNTTITIFDDDGMFSSNKDTYRLSNLCLFMPCVFFHILSFYFLAALVGFESSYTFNEIDGRVEICVVVSNPNVDELLAFNIITVHVTRSGTAG